MSRIITAFDLGKILIDAGLIPPTTRRFVIDCDLDKPVTIYVEQFADERLLEVISGNAAAIIAGKIEE